MKTLVIHRGKAIELPTFHAVRLIKGGKATLANDEAGDDQPPASETPSPLDLSVDADSSGVAQSATSNGTAEPDQAPNADTGAEAEVERMPTEVVREAEQEGDAPDTAALDSDPAPAAASPSPEATAVAKEVPPKRRYNRRDMKAQD